MKTNADILADQDAFKAAVKRARAAFQAFDGVLGVGFGLREKGEQFEDDIAITVYVREKKSEDALAPAERIPPVFEDYPTDVRVVRRAHGEACDNATRFAKIKGGIQIMGKRSPTAHDSQKEFQGTLGCIVRKRQDLSRDNVYLLTNKHVLFSPELGADETVFHPTLTGDREGLGPVQSGGLYGIHRYKVDGRDDLADDFFVDCAIARINIDCKCWGTRCTKDDIEIEEAKIVDLQLNGVDTISDVRSVIGDVAMIGKKVFKVGRTTGKTAGTVVSVTGELTADPEPDKTNPAFIIGPNTLEIIFDKTSTPNGLNCHGNPHFTEKGDSGSIIVDELNRVIGLHSHRDQVRAAGTPLSSHACHILPVLETLGICIPVTTGTSTGSSKATDGTGLLPAVNPAGDFPLPDGQIIFTEAAIEVVPINAEEEQRMRALLDEFRSTEKGRELHEFFGFYRREIGYLVRNHKLVKATWHRHKGPAFLTHVLNHFKGEIDRVPGEVDGVSAITLVTRMFEVLRTYASNPVRAFIEEHEDEVMRLMQSGEITTARDCIAYLQKREATA